MLAIQLIRIRGLDLGYIGLQDTGTGNRKQGYRIQNTGHRIHETGHKIQGYWIQNQNTGLHDTEYVT